jgi:predicted AAA+ superfamily ATPase
MADTNPWWIANKGIDAEVNQWPRRAYFPAFMRLIRTTEVRRAVVVIGPRRVGKTVMLLQAVQSLLDAGVPGTHILVAQMDVPLFAGQSLDSLMRLFIDLHGHGRKETIAGVQPSHPYYIFFDEIQYLKDWETHLKVLVDTQKQVRFIATGSAAAALRIKSKESGAGRFSDFVLPPLTFAEYLDFCGQGDLVMDDAPAEAPKPDYRARDIGKLNAEFVNYLNYGGFPEAVMNKAVREDPKRYLRQDIVDKVLQKDLPSLMGISDTQELNRFFNVLAYNTGAELSPNQLSKSTGIASRKIEEYLEYLEAAYLIKRLMRIDQTARRMQRATTYKVYLTNPSIRAALFGIARGDDEAMGRLVETAVWSQWLHSTETIASTHYARWRKGRTDYEVDLVGLAAKDQKPKWAVEVKWSDRAWNDSNELKGLRVFLGEHTLARPALVTTKTEQGIQTIDGHTVEFCPSSLHCYIVGKNLLR